MKIFAFFLILFIYSCSEKSISDKKTTNDFYDKAWIYLEKNESLNAFVYFVKAKDLYIKNKDSLGAGKSLMNMSIILADKGDYFSSQETSLEALKYLNTKNKEHYKYLKSNFNSLGISTYNIKNYNDAVKFYDLAIKFSDNPFDTKIYLNNKALTLQKIKNYNEAFKIYNEILKKESKNKIEYSRALSNLAKTKWLQNPDYNPVPEFQKALNIRIKEKDNWGLNASYAHLADYYSKAKPDSALFFARKMYETAKEIKSPDDQTEALQKLISLENSENSKQYFKIYQNLNDSLQTARNKAKNQFALIRYETEKNKADFLKAKAESSQRQNHIIKQYFALGFSLLIIGGLYLYLKRRQKTLRQEKLLEVKNTELKYSKKVHDKVANRIYQIMSQVENTENIDKNAILFGLENVYKISRDISYDNKDINENQNFFEQLDNMLDSYSSKSVQVIFNGNNEKLWESISFQNKTEIYLILQELMTNMKKHSQANIVFLKFTKENSNINISYTDNGIGMKHHSPKNGLQNMENRINSINGKINFDTETNNLLKINISFPI